MGTLEILNRFIVIRKNKNLFAHNFSLSHSLVALYTHSKKRKI